MSSGAAATPAAAARAPGPALAPRLAVALAATLAAAGLGALLLAALLPEAPPPRPAPFGLGLREAAPAPEGLGARLLALQGAFYEALREAVAGLRDGSGGLLVLAGLGFAYGVLHAAGPGHGKAVISAYLVADGRALSRGFSLSLAAAVLQALVAIGLVGGATFLLGATARGMDAASRAIELASFAAVAAIGAAILWRKAGGFLGTLAALRAPRAGPAQEACCPAHLASPERVARLSGLREAAGVVVAAGARPCAGAIVVLVFAASQGLFAAGVAATAAMALGTALTTGAIATLAVFGKRLALALAGGRGAAGTIFVAALELLAAAAVLVLGLALLIGLWRSAGL